jgi:hypothetical protein
MTVAARVYVVPTTGRLAGTSAVQERPKRETGRELYPLLKVAVGVIGQSYAVAYHDGGPKRRSAPVGHDKIAQGLDRPPARKPGGWFEPCPRSGPTNRARAKDRKAPCVRVSN